MGWSDMLAITAIVIALASAAFTGLQWRLGKRKENREIAALDPQINPKCRSIDAWPGWFQITLDLQNRYNASMHFVELRCRRPQSGRLLHRQPAQRDKDERSGTAPLVAVPPLDEAKFALQCNYVLAPYRPEETQVMERVRLSDPPRVVYNAPTRNTRVHFLFAPGRDTEYAVFDAVFERADDRIRQRVMTFSVKLTSDSIHQP